MSSLLRFLACGTLGLASSWAAYGQAGGAGGAGSGGADQRNANDELQEVIVTAEKRAENVQSVPEAITVVGAQQLQDQHVESISDLSQTAPSLEVIQAFGGPGGGGQIRGIGTQSFTRSAEGSVGVVVDGISQGNLNVSDIFDIGHIEVLEGPQGTLFGLTSSAGVINIETNAPDLSRFETIWHVDYAHDGTLGSEFGEELAHGVVNLPVSSDSALRVAMSLDNRMGVQDNDYDHTQSFDDNYAVRARYLWKASDDIQVNVIADVQRTLENDGEDGSTASFTYVYANPILTGELASCGITPGWGNQNRCASHPYGGYDTNDGLSSQVDFDLGPSTLSSITAFRHDEGGPDAQDVQAVPQEIPQLWQIGALSASSQYSEELRLTSHANSAVDYTAGLYYLNYLTLGYNGAGAFFHIQLPFPPFELGSAQTQYTQTSNKSSAAYGQVTWHVIPKVGVILGARYTYQTITDYDSPLGLMPGAAGNAGSTALGVIEHNVSGKVGLQYTVDPDWQAYATVTKGYKGPQAQAATATTPAILVPAEIPLAFEIGLKGTTWQDRLAIDLALFGEKDHNYQGQSCSLSALGVLVCIPNTVDVTTKGMELTLNARPTSHWNLTGGYIYDDAVYPYGYLGENPNALVGPDTSLPLGGQQLIGVPRDKLTFTTDYTLPLGPVQGFIGADAVYRSTLLLGPSPTPDFYYPGHWTLGARVGLQSADSHWSLTLFGRDINNSHQPLTLFAGPAYLPPGAVPAYPFGAVSGVSGWIGPQSLREVGLSIDLQY